MARGFVCEVDGAYRSACAGLDVYGEYEDKHYCVLHFPGEDKEDDFEKVKESKLAQRDYDFGGTVFPEGTSDFSDDIFNGEASFRKATFKGKADFEGAIFKGEASFRKATFKREADFEGAIFKGEASFREATFNEKGDFAKANFAKLAGFRNVTFEKQANFIETIFDQEARFRRTVFQGFVEFKGPSITGPSNEDPCETHTFNKRANFSAAKFEERAVFLGRCTFDTTQEEATFRNALIEKPENFSFDRVWLRPSWFIDTNVQQLRFTNVQWRGFRGGPPGSIVEEIKAIDARRNRRRSKEEEEEEDSQSGYLFDVLAKT